MHERPYDVLIIGAGQAGLAVASFLARSDLRFAILERHGRLGESWRQRWDSLRLFTPARYDGLPGWPFPAPAHHYPTKDEMADYLEAYAARFGLPVRTGVNVDRLARADGAGYLAQAGAQRFEASQVVIATGAFQVPRVPPLAHALDPTIRQLHSSQYRRPGQVAEGPVLVVGAGNSGAEIAHELAADHQVWLVGPNNGETPFDASGPIGRLIDPLFWFVLNHVLSVDNPIGRRAMARLRSRGAPLERTRSGDLAAAGVTRVRGRVIGVRDGLPLLGDGRALEVASVVWCTGFGHDFAWLDLPVQGPDGWPAHERGVSLTSPGLSFVGLPFLRSLASSLVGGVGRDARHVARSVIHAARANSTASGRTAARQPVPGG
jgi:putative flavoprotein involved in K+ transport